jgi:hypothetical protein
LDRRGPFGHPDRAMDSAAPQEVQQHSFRLVLLVVSGCDRFRAGFPGRLDQQPIPLPPRRLFKPNARMHLLRNGPHHQTLEIESQRCGQVCRPRRVIPGSRPQAMVNVDQQYFETDDVARPTQRRGQGQRIASTRKGDNQPVLAPKPGPPGPSQQPLLKPARRPLLTKSTTPLVRLRTPGRFVVWLVL